MQSNLELTAPGEYQLTVLEGKTLQLRDPRQIDLGGIFSSPSEFVTKRKAEIEAKKAHAIFDYPQGTITFTQNETDHFNFVVVGALTLHPLLKELNINTSAGYSPESLYDALRFQKRFFAQRGDHIVLMNRLLNFSVKITQELEKHNDNKGNTNNQKKVSLEAKNQTDLQLDFSLKLEIFGGTEPEIIDIRPEFEVVNSRPIIYLISDDYEEKIDTLTHKMFEEQRPFFEDYVIITKK